MKKIILHMDDMGMSYAANLAGMSIFENGIAKSASIMAPCAWAKEFAEYSRLNPQYDVGAHLTFTSEWDRARWRLFTPYDVEPGFYDEMGFARLGRTDENKIDVSAESLLREMKYQYEHLKKWGANISHFDSHMFSNYMEDEHLRASIEFANECNVKITLSEELMWSDERTLIASKRRNVEMKRVNYVGTDDFNETRDIFINALDGIEEGIYHCPFHPIVETEEIKQIIPEWKNRVVEYQLLMDRTLLEEFEKRKIEIISWADVPFIKE